VINGVGADGLIVAARTEAQANGEGDAVALFVVDADAPGVAVTPQQLADARNHARVSLAGVRVDDERRLGAAPAGVALEAALDRARVLLAAETLGLLREVFERTLGYLKEREQFGVPIGSFQALQHRAARLYVELELLESAVAAAQAAIDADSPELPRLASLAKARAADLAVTLCNEAVQLHGGIGVTDEYDLGLFLKRARVLQHLLGDAAFHRDRYARLTGF
jgi:alkylation response protein AidB-like acyl-CoA dehydrogenase